MEMTVKFTNEKVSYTDKKDGKQKSFEKLVMELPDGKTMNLNADQYNFRAIGYIVDQIDNNKGK